MKRVLPVLSLVLLPSVVLAAALSSSAEVIGSVLSEMRPIVFSVSASHHGGAVTSVKVQGQKEGAGPEKGWVSIKTEWKGGSAWMNTEADVRVKSGKAYFRLASVTGSADAPDFSAFRALQGKWFLLDLSDNGVKTWLSPLVSSHDLGMALGMTSEKFREGYSYTFTPVMGAEAVRNDLQASLPWLIAPESSGPMKAKIDTNMSNEFQFGSLQFGSTFEAKAQRQFHAVYVETPVTTTQLPDGAVKQFFFQTSGVADVTDAVSEPQESAMSSSVSMQTGRVSAPQSVTVTALSRRERRKAERAVVHLHGPESKDLRLSVLIATGPMQWDSAAAFDADFSAGRGILYHYQKPTDVRFSTQHAYAGLEVMFFDEAGRFISSATMPRCQTRLCPTFGPDRPAMFALEVGIGFLDRTKIGPLWRLSLDWSAAPLAGANLQQSDRNAARVIENRLKIPAPRGWHSVESSGGDQSLRILAETTATKIRVADIAAASGVRRDEDASHRLYATLVDTMHTNHLRYAFIVVPSKTPDTFSLVLDSYTYASVDVLDVNGNGKLDNDEKPAAPGSTYLYPAFTAAMTVATFDESSAGELAVYVPVKDDNGTTVAVLALVK